MPNMSSEDENEAGKGSEKPSTSRPTRPRRTIMTPSPLVTSESEDEEMASDTETANQGRMHQQQSRKTGNGENVAGKGSEKPSTSRPTRPRRTIMTPSPLVTSESENEEMASDTETANQGRMHQQQSRKTGRGENVPGSEETPKKRSYTGENSSDEMNRSQKKKRVNARTRSTPQGKNSSDVEEEDNSRKQSRKKRPSSSSPKKRETRKKQKVVTPRSFRTPSPATSMFSQAPLTSHPGVLKTLKLTNFMCHSNFEHHFHPNLNFITGQNGSGKSALLSGILIALGGKASITSRTTSLQSLVQKGKHMAQVSVTLLNKKGLRKYGDEITIQRTISARGGGGYKIKSSGGRNQECIFNWRPLKKAELDSILIGMNIQIDNPVAILNQEVARSFLRTKDPKDKYRLFYDGTLLSKLEAVLRDTKQNLDETEVILKQKRAIVTAVRDEVRLLQQKVEKIAELDKIKGKLTTVHQEYLWSVVIQQERSVEEVRKSINDMEGEMELLVKRLDKLKTQYANLSEESVVREQDQVRDALKQKQRDFDRNRAEMADIRRNYAHIKAKLRTIISNVETTENKMKQTTEAIEKVKAAQDAKSREETNQDSKRLDHLQSEKKHCESAINAIKLDAENFRQAAELEREKLQQFENEGRSIRTHIEGKKRHIAALNSRTTNKYAAFGPKMEQLMTKIQASAHKFRSLPKGPLGACITVKDQKYAPIIENVLGKFLDSFVVGDARDLNTLREMIDFVYGDRAGSQRRQTGPPARMPGIHCIRYADREYNVHRNHAAHPLAPSILQLIDIENNDYLLLNALIDIAEIERVIVFQDSQTACSILKNESTVPKGLKCAYTLQCFKFTAAPHYAAQVMRMKTSASILKSGRNKDGEIKALKGEIRELEVQLQDLEPGRAEIKANEQSLRKTFEEKNNELIRMRRKLGEIVNEIKRHVTKMQTKEKRCDLTSYYEELEELKDDLKTAISNREAANRELEPMKPQLNTLEQEKQRLEDEVRALTTRMNSFDEDRDKLKTQRMQMDSLIKRTKSKLDSLESSKSPKVRELKEKEGILNEKTKVAMEECRRRVDTKRAPEDVRTEFQGLKIRIKETEARLGDGEELRRTLKKRQKEFHSLSREYNPLKSLLEIVKTTNTDQSKSFVLLRNHLARTLTIFYASMSKQRGYEGRLMVDYDTKELHYFVCPDGDSSLKTVKALDKQQKLEEDGAPLSAEHVKKSKLLKKQLQEYALGLSGGERSFATICFVMALWQVMECPFYMLDEFDVFMDAFNRKTSQMALMAHAKRFTQNQFILFTPLDLGELPSSNEACVLRLFPPVRGKSGQGSTSGENNSSEAASSSNQATSSKGRISGSPNESTENIDPSGGVPKSKGADKVRIKKKRQAPMNEI